MKVQQTIVSKSKGGSNLKRGAINNSLLDLVTDSRSVLGYSLGLKTNPHGGAVWVV